MTTPSNTLSFAWEPAPVIAPIVPFFLPFKGCPTRCIFCAQDKTTGVDMASERSHVLLARLLGKLALRRDEGKAPPELGLYGGTFTALHDDERKKILKQVHKALRDGIISNVRCSTRPDCVDLPRLEELKDAGFTTVELGVQSFSTQALAASLRGYDLEVCEQAMQRVLSVGFRLGVQLLPGMPAVSPEVFLQDVRLAITLGCQLLRFYPCLVLLGTGLERLWREGRYHPWDLETTLDALSRGYLLARKARVPVIRMGLAPEPGLSEVVLAGPQHPALGARVMARALFLTVEQNVRTFSSARLKELLLPLHVQGFFWGDRGELAKDWQSLGLERASVHFVKTKEVRLIFE